MMALPPGATAYRLLTGTLLILEISAGWVRAAGPSPRTAPPPTLVTVQAQDGANLAIVDQPLSTQVVVKLATPAHDWFQGTFFHLATDAPTTLGFSMRDNNTERNTADVSKWRHLLPVFSYADPQQPASYIWYTKGDDGHWRSSETLLPPAQRDAGTGPVPQQNVITPDLAPAFLDATGTTWVPWRTVEAAEAVPNLNLFHVTQQFARSTATVAMRVPYPSSHLQALTNQLREAALPGVTIDEVGMTPEKRALQVIRLDPPTPQAATTLDRPTILVYAREHGTEPDGSWTVEGILRWLLSDDPAATQSRQTTTWLLIPMLDVDAAARAEYRLGDFYSASVKPPLPEAVAYATYLVQRLNAGGRLDVAVNLHNIECDEGPNILNPVINPARQAAIVAFNTQLFTRAKHDGYTVGEPTGWQVGYMRQRLAGWCNTRFGTLDLVYELNACDGTSRLLPPRVAELGLIVAQELATFIQSPQFTPISTEITQRLADRHAEAATWWTTVGHPANARTPFDLFTKGL